MDYWFFGIPGSGKSHVADLFSQMTGIPQYEGDDFHTEDDRHAVAEGTFTLERRHAQLSRISAALRIANTKNALITHPLPDRSSRVRVRSAGGVQLVYVRAPLHLVKVRLRARTSHHFTSDLLDAWLLHHWQEPKDEDCFVIDNGEDSSALTARLQELLHKQKG